MTEIAGLFAFLKTLPETFSFDRHNSIILISITLLLIILTVITSIIAFSNPVLRQRCLFIPAAVSGNGEWFRFITSGFIHAGWMHLAVNMWVLWLFGPMVEHEFTVMTGPFGRLAFLGLYFGGLIVSDLPTYFKFRNTPSYSALGASGAVSAVLFAYVLTNPFTGGIGLLFIPIMLPPAVFGLLYLLYSVYMSRQGRDHINHDAHFYGALFGLSYPLIFQPSLALEFIQQIVHSL